MSIIDVAKLAGVSKSTVSLVINNNPAVTATTAKRVRHAMEKLKYVPPVRDQRRGPKPNSMYPSRTLNIALVTLGFPAAVLRAPLYHDVVHGIEAEVREQRHRLLYYNLPSARDFKREHIFGSQVDGYLLLGKGESAGVVQALADIPCVALLGANDAPRAWCDWVGYDDSVVGKLAARYLLERNCNNCVYLGDSNWTRAKAFSAAMRAAKGKVTVLDAEGLIHKNDDVHEVNEDALDALVDRLMAMSPRPTGLFAWADMITAVLCPALCKRRFEPGRDIKVVTCNNEWPLLFGLRPRPGIVDIQGVKIARRSVQQLLWRMQNRREPRVSVLLEPRLIPGEKR